MFDTDVLIVGGGATGLTASMLLTELGVKHRLISRYRETSPLPKAHLLSLKTMEIFRALGLEAAIVAGATPAANMRHTAWYAGLAGADPDHGREIARISAWGQGGENALWAEASPVRYQNLPQAKLEPILRAAAEARAPGQIAFYHELEALEMIAGGARATIRDRAADTPYTLTARYVLACDGGRNIGPWLGIAMAGHENIATNITVHFRADLSDWLHSDDVLIRGILNPDTGHPGMLVSMGPEDWGRQAREWVYHMLAFPGDRNAFDDAEAVRRMCRNFGLPDLPVEVLQITRWPLNAFVATDFRRGPVFLLGDAAHKMPPSGGLGLNCAVQDAYNLCWKLAAVLGGQAGEALLDSYAQERRAVAELTVGEAFRNWQNTRLFTEGLGFAPDHDAARNWQGLRAIWAEGAAGAAARRRAVAGMSVLANTYSHLNVNFGYHYASDAVAHEAVPAPVPLDPVKHYRPTTRPGHTLPHVWLGDTGGRYSIHDCLAAGRWTLIVDAVGAAGWRQAAAALVAARGLALDVLEIDVPAADRVDLYGEWLARREVGPGGAVLVRPDRYVGWRAMAAPADPAAVLAAAFAAILPA